MTLAAAQQGPSSPGPEVMERRPFGPVPHKVAMIGQGTWYIGDADRPSAVAALRRGLELGMTHIDTAEMYGDAEIVVGEAIAGRREEVSIRPMSSVCSTSSTPWSTPATASS